MSIRILLTIALLALSAKGAALPGISELKPGDRLEVKMTLFGYSITGADFLFTSEKVTVTPEGGKATDLVLTADEKARVEEYLKLVTRGTKRRASATFAK